MSSSSAWNAVVVPSTPLMISPLGAADPLGDVRSLAVDAVRWLVSTSPARVVVLTATADTANVARGVTSPLGERVARSLLAAAGFTGEVFIGWSSSCLDTGADRPTRQPPRNESDQTRPHSFEDTAVLVVGDGSARRGEKAPGHLDERSFEFDATVEKALTSCSASDLGDLSVPLGAELLAAGTPAFRALGALPGAGAHVATLDYSDDPLGVQYWIVRWTCAS